MDGREESDEGSMCALQERVAEFMWMRLMPFCFVLNIYMSRVWPDQVAGRKSVVYGAKPVEGTTV